MSAHDPQDQHHDAPVPPVRPAAAPRDRADATPSVRDLLASCAAARTVSTPPADTPPAGTPAAGTPAAGTPAAGAPASGAEAAPEPSRGRDAA